MERALDRSASRTAVATGHPARTPPQVRGSEPSGEGTAASADGLVSSYRSENLPVAADLGCLDAF
jgi:hypothetical protein